MNQSLQTKVRKYLRDNLTVTDTEQYRFNLSRDKLIKSLSDNIDEKLIPVLEHEIDKFVIRFCKLENLNYQETFTDLNETYYIINKGSSWILN